MLYSGQEMGHDPDRGQELMDMQEPEMDRELKQIVHAVGHLDAYCSTLVGLGGAVANSARGCLRDTTRTRRMVGRRPTASSTAVTEGHENAWGAAKEFVEAGESLRHIKARRTSHF